jgi:amino acid adenylation domain-containing protein
LDLEFGKRLKRIAFDPAYQCPAQDAAVTIATLFAHAVRHHSDKIAVTDGVTSLSYADLNKMSEIIGQGVDQQVSRQDAVVAILMNRSSEMVATIFGVLKSGRTYVIIDPRYPTQRITHMLADTACDCILTTQTLRDKIPVEYQGNILLVEEIRAAGNDNECLVTEIKPDSLLYIIYTSGSTGIPKGVAVENQSVANMALSYIGRFNVTQEDRVLQFASMSFAASVIEVYVALLSGANLIIIPDEIKLNHERFSEFVKQQSVSIALLPPNYATELSPQNLPLRMLVTAGSSTNWKIVDKWVGHVQYCNVYGCSETATGVSAYTAGGPRKTKSVPIGTPNANTQYYLLQAEGASGEEPLEGELCVAGTCVARCYLNQPALTEQKFIRTLDDKGNNIRVYRTGDIVRISEDGDVEILGRVDDQLNINGYRIEPEEVNVHVAKLPGIENSVVIAKEVRGKQAIVAYCVSKEKNLFMVLRQHLMRSLPDYMLPHYVVSIDSIPLTINGKLDKSALPDPVSEQAWQQLRAAPQTEEEQVLLAIWSDVLGISKEQLGVDDNYFYLGGDSITAIQIVSRLYQQNYIAQMLDLMTAPTIRSFAVCLKPKPQESAGQAHDLVEPVNAPMANHIVQRIRTRFETLNLQLPMKVQALKRYPLSHMQSGIYLSYLRSKDSQYIVHNVFNIDGSLDVEKFTRCLEKLIERHDILRSVYTHFESEQGYQVVMDSLPLRLRFTDMSFIGSVAPMQELEDWIHQDRKRQFELECENAIRFHLLKWSEKKYSLVVCYHHIIMDGWCLNILWSELQRYYYDDEMPTERAILPVMSYASYINWLAGLDQSAARNYWQSCLQEYQPVAVSRAVNDEEELKYRVDHFTIDATRTSAVKDLAKHLQLTLSSILKTCWGLTLCSDKNVADVIFGEVLAGRPPHLPGSENIIGLFVNTVPTRIKMLPQDSFASLAGRVQKASIEAQQHQYLSLPEIQTLPDVNHNLIDHIFVYENYPPLTTSGKDVRNAFKVEAVMDIDEVNYHLNVSVSVDEEIRVRILYRDPVFSQQRIKELFDQYSRVIASICQEPQRTLNVNSNSAHAPTLSVIAGEQKNCPAVSIADLFKESAHRFPGEIAVEQMPDNAAGLPVFGATLTYAQLNGRANQLAQHLLNRGLGAGSTLAIYLPRSTDYIVSLFAALKIGAVYLPLDQSNDPARTRAILHWSKPDVVICRGVIADDIKIDTAHINIEIDIDTITRCSPADFFAESDGSGIAQLLFTSGTTGDPKGVKVTHKGLINHALFVRDQLRLTPQDSVLQFANLGFDAFSEELFPTLLSGARLILRNKDLLQSYDALNKAIGDYRIAVVDLPTAYWNHWVDSLVMSEALLVDLASLRNVILGGESISVAHVKKWQEMLGDIAIANTYGPTETTVICTWHQVTTLAATDNKIPIGKPIANTQLFVLDEKLQPVAMGAVGQLYIAGDGLSLGYLNLPEKTAAAFVTKTLGDVEHRLYATGDQVYMDPATRNIYYVGRVDSVIKLRGYRVDLADIKKKLEEYPAIKLAYIDVLEDGSNKTLITYLQADHDDHRAQIEDHINSSLPSQLRPMRICFVKQWPLNAHGKIDAKRLRELLGSTAISAPRTSEVIDHQPSVTEVALQTIWQDILGITVAELDRSFFDLGGHSLHAIAMLTKIHRSLKVKLTVDVLFKHPSIKALAQQIEASGQKSEASAIVRLSSGQPGTKNMFVFPPVGGELFCYKPLADRLDNTYTIYGCRDVRLNALDQPLSITQLATEYVQELQKIQAQGPYLLAGWSMGGVVAQEVAHLLESRGEKVHRLYLIESWHPSVLPDIDLSQDALVREYVNNLVRSNQNSLAFAPIESTDLREIWKHLVANGLLGEDAEFSTFYRYFQVYRNNSMALRNHVPQQFRGRTLLFRSTCPSSDVGVSHKQLGWQTTIKDLIVIDNHADHYSQLQGETLNVIAEVLLDPAKVHSVALTEDETINEVH